MVWWTECPQTLFKLDQFDKYDRDLLFKESQCPIKCLPENPKTSCHPVVYQVIKLWNSFHNLYKEFLKFYRREIFSEIVQNFSVGQSTLMNRYQEKYFRSCQEYQEGVSDHFNLYFGIFDIEKCQYGLMTANSCNIWWSKNIWKFLPYRLRKLVWFHEKYYVSFQENLLMLFLSN